MEQLAVFWRFFALLVGARPKTVGDPSRHAVWWRGLRYGSFYQMVETSAVKKGWEI